MSIHKSRVIGSVSASLDGGEAFVYHPVGAAIAGAATKAKSEPAAPSFNWGTTDLKKYSEEDLQAQKKQAWEQGRRDAAAELEKALAAERAKVAHALEGFAAERKAYLESVEVEVVRLALSIARKILHREAQIDPLLLSGVVRVALEKVVAGSSVKLRVTESEMFKWRQVISAVKNLHPSPEVVGDPKLGAGQCILETEVGNTNLSLDTQLQEVERGLLDLLALRPAA